ncbi:related to glutaminase A [Phialocephala subalpina]|uniref:Related to glutaminase A n=1 Tax=Phialocephala subalpina TaxID=576137 RepID=A0A1L7WGD3_9HELO|nr:related to glutaminase A [Phialocephala subalpina]
MLWGKKGADAAITPVVEAGDENPEEPTGLEQSKQTSLKARYSRFKNFYLESKVLRISCIALIVALLALLVALLAYTQTRRRPVATHPSTNFTHIPIQPASYPLSVRSPYLSTWIPGGLVEKLPYSSPQFWTGASLGWSIMARVDNVTYSLMGVSKPANGTVAATVLKGEFTSTHTYFTLRAGGTNLTLDFLSPVSPSNYLRQSLPFSYLTITASSKNGNTVQVYTDLDDSWTGQDDNTIWNFTSTTNTSMFSMSAVGTSKYSQRMEQALWGDVILASRASNSSKLSIQAGDRAAVRKAFAGAGSLTGATPDWNANGVMGMAHDLGLVRGDSAVTFAVGYVREDAINYLGRPYTGYYRSSYPNTLDAVSYFLDDLQDAEDESLRLDSDVIGKSTAVAGTNYSDVVALSMRQAYGGIDLVVPSNTTNTSEVLAFIKEISSDGNVNTIDVIFPAFPIYWAMDPEWIRLLLDPVLQYLSTGAWKRPFVIHDIGSNYPNATGHDDQRAEEMPIEETGNLMILAYAYVLASNNTEWANQYLSLFQNYTDYLVNNSLNISLQLSTNDAAGPLVNETNLAVKGALGLKAFGLLSGMTNYSSLGDAHASLLYTDGLATSNSLNATHFTLEYPSSSFENTWKVTFNLFPDVLLNLSTFPTSAYDTENTFYPQIRSQGGVALDNRQWWAKTDWNLWTAAAASSSGSNTTRDMMVNDIWAYASNGMNEAPFSDRYVVKSEGAPRMVGREFALRARPTVGGHFALLAMLGARCLKW